MSARQICKMWISNRIMFTCNIIILHVNISIYLACWHNYVACQLEYVTCLPNQIAYKHNYVHIDIFIRAEVCHYSLPFYDMPYISFTLNNEAKYNYLTYISIYFKKGLCKFNCKFKWPVMSVQLLRRRLTLSINLE